MSHNWFVLPWRPPERLFLQVMGPALHHWHSFWTKLTSIRTWPDLTNRQLNIWPDFDRNRPDIWLTPDNWLTTWERTTHTSSRRTRLRIMMHGNSELVFLPSQRTSSGKSDVSLFYLKSPYFYFKLKLSRIKQKKLRRSSLKIRRSAFFKEGCLLNFA